MCGGVRRSLSLILQEELEMIVVRELNFRDLLLLKVGGEGLEEKVIAGG